MSEAGTTPVYWQLIEPYWDKISIYDGPTRFLREFGRAPQAVQSLFAAHWLQSEVCNGGFGQFFDNSTGVLAPEAAAGFLTIGMPKVSAFVSDLIGGFGADYPRDEDQRGAALAEIDEAMSAANPLNIYVDQDFFDLLASENGGFLVSANQYAERFLQ
ncbi:DUF4375 domain-containing protein [uncultured Brevundimonas sp.]|uniref:DMP19 family protein n=1 Tax=uncultured Brevundimonas sp. TaxID=213418 RepID=UPI0030ECFDF2